MFNQVKIFRRIFSKVGMADFDNVHIQMLGAEQSFGEKHAKHTREVNFNIFPRVTFDIISLHMNLLHINHRAYHKIKLCT